MKRKIFLLGVIFLGVASVLFNNDKKEEATPKTKKPEVKVEVPPMETAEATVEEEEEEIATPQQETNYDGWFESSERAEMLKEYEKNHYNDETPNMADETYDGKVESVRPTDAGSDKNSEEALKKEEEGWKRLDSSATEEEQINNEEE